MLTDPNIIVVLGYPLTTDVLPDRLAAHLPDWTPDERQSAELLVQLAAGRPDGVGTHDQLDPCELSSWPGYYGLAFTVRRTEPAKSEEFAFLASTTMEANRQRYNPDDKDGPTVFGPFVEGGSATFVLVNRKAIEVPAPA
jgi:hypothetical protein